MTVLVNPFLHHFLRHYPPASAALSRLSFTLNMTILPIKSNGIGLSSGNRIEPLAPS